MKGRKTEFRPGANCTSGKISFYSFPANILFLHFLFFLVFFPCNFSGFFSGTLSEIKTLAGAAENSGGAGAISCIAELERIKPSKLLGTIFRNSGSEELACVLWIAAFGNNAIILEVLEKCGLDRSELEGLSFPGVRELASFVAEKVDRVILLEMLCNLADDEGIRDILAQFKEAGVGPDELLAVYSGKGSLVLFAESTGIRPLFTSYAAPAEPDKFLTVKRLEKDEIEYSNGNATVIKKDEEVLFWNKSLRGKIRNSDQKVLEISKVSGGKIIDSIYSGFIFRKGTEEIIVKSDSNLSAVFVNVEGRENGIVISTGGENEYLRFRKEIFVPSDGEYIRYMESINALRGNITVEPEKCEFPVLEVCASFSKIVSFRDGQRRSCEKDALQRDPVYFSDALIVDGKDSFSIVRVLPRRIRGGILPRVETKENVSRIVMNSAIGDRWEPHEIRKGSTATQVFIIGCGGDEEMAGKYFTLLNGTSMVTAPAASEQAALLKNDSTVTLWQETPLVLPSSSSSPPLRKSESLKISLAANEVESTILAVRPKFDIQNARFRFTYFDGPEKLEAGELVRLRKIVPVLSPDSRMADARTGDIPDVLQEFTVTFLEKEKNNLFLLTARAGENAIPGDYTGYLTLENDTTGETVIAVTIRIYPFKLQKRPAFRIIPAVLEEYLRLTDPSEEQFFGRQTLEACWNSLDEHRMSSPGILPDVKIEAAGEGLKIDSSEFNSALIYLVRTFRFDRFIIPFPSFPGTGDDLSAFPGFAGRNRESVEFEGLLSAYISYMKELLGRQNLLKESLLIVWDTPGPAVDYQLRKLLALIGRYGSGLNRVVISRPSDELDSLVEFFICPHEMIWKESFRKKVIIRDDEILMGVGISPMLVKERVIRAKTTGVAGIFIWAINYWGDILEKPGAGGNGRYFLRNMPGRPARSRFTGDGMLVYPPVAGKGKFLDSLRYENLRDALEDLSYLEFLDSISRTGKTARIDELERKFFGSFENDVPEKGIKDYYEFREGVAELVAREKR